MTPNQAMRDGILAMLRGQSDTGVWADCIALWDLDDPVGSGWATDTIAGAQALTTVQGTTITYGVTGKVGYGVTFDASAAYYAAGLAGLSGDFSIAFWFKPNEAPSPGVFKVPILFGSGGDTGLVFTDAPLVRFVAAGVTVAEYAGSALTAAAWNHYVVTRTSGTYAIYRNGAALSLTTSVNSTTSYANTAISFGDFNSVGTGSTMDQVAFWSRALSAGQVATLYGAGSGYAYESSQLYAPAGPFLDIEMGPFTANEDPLTVLERMSAVGARFPGLFLSKFPIDVSAPSDEQRSSPGRQLGYDANWLLVAVFPTLRDTDAVGSREWEVFEWRSRVKLAMESKFIAGVPATPAGWEFRWARYTSFSGVYLPEAYVETLPFVVRADGACRNDV